MFAGLPVATTVSRCFQGSEESSCSLYNRCFEHLRVQVRERQIEREMFVPKVQLCFAEDPSGVTLITVLLSAISRHCKDRRKKEAGNKLASFMKSP